MDSSTVHGVTNAPADQTLLAFHPVFGPGLTSAATPLEVSQRARILDAALIETARRGFPKTSVSDIVKTAGVSRSTFYDMFVGKEECFVEAFNHARDVLLERVRHASLSRLGDWRAELRAGATAYVTTLADDEIFARAYLIEVQLAGPAALEARSEAMGKFADRYRATFARAMKMDGRDLPEPDADLLYVLCAGTQQLMAERVRQGTLKVDVESVIDTFCRAAEAVLLHAYDEDLRDPSTAT